MKRIIYFVILVFGLSVIGLSLNSCSCSNSSSDSDTRVCSSCGRTYDADEPGSSYDVDGSVYCSKCAEKRKEEADRKWKQEQMKKLKGFM